jgi:hypothetical protein
MFTTNNKILQKRMFYRCGEGLLMSTARGAALIAEAEATSRTDQPVVDHDDSEG